MKLVILFLAGVLLGWCPALLRAEDLTEISITSNVLVKDCIPFGLNFVPDLGDVKQPIVFNFEGQAHRFCTEGEIFSNGFFSYQMNARAITNNNLAAFYKGATITILSGTAKGEKRRIAKLEIRKRWAWRWDVVKLPEPPALGFFVFDKPVNGLPEGQRIDLEPFHQAKKDSTKEFNADPTKNIGAMIERDYLDVGFVGYNYKQWRLSTKEAGATALVQGDVPQGSFGQTALQISSVANKPASVMLFLANDSEVNCNAIYHFSFWAKAKSGNPEAALAWDDPRGTPAVNFALTSAWKQFTCSFDFRGKYPATCPDALPAKPRSVTCRINITGGNILLDDVVVRVEGDANPTPFRDETVNLLKKFRPGILRQLMEGGDSIHNEVQLRERQNMISGDYASKHDATLGNWFNNRRLFSSLPEYYALCEYLQCGAWFNISGTLYPEEIEQLMEYLAAPADVGLGKLRAAQGHPKPWTESIPRIYIEFGNEIWNFMGAYKHSSYAGPDYWDGMITRAKASPYYRKNILFTMGVDGGFQNVPHADLVMNRAPYVVHNLGQNIVDRFPDRKDLARWIFGYGLERNVFGKDISNSAAMARKAGQELAVYEVNYHTTEPKQTEAVRNQFLPSLGAGVNIANTVLGQLKAHGVRSQCFFSDRGNFNWGGSNTKLWGIILSSRQGKVRCRPAFWALAMANQLMNGDLVETTHRGAAPTFSTLHLIPYKTPETFVPVTYPSLYSYAFRDGTRHGIILVNLDLDKKLAVRLTFSGVPQGPAQKAVLTADAWLANNEVEHDAQVRVAESTINDFKSAALLQLPACSLTTVQWDEK